MPAFMTNDGVVTEICPPLPGVRSATAVTEKGGLFRAPSTSRSRRYQVDRPPVSRLRQPARQSSVLPLRNAPGKTG